MLFSVVIPSYNRAAFILKTVDSVIKQSFPDFEIIVIDDGSTDDTESILKKAYGVLPNFSYYKTENKERGAARNYGFSKARGKYVCFLDSDDLLLPNHLEVLNQSIIENPQVNFWVTKFQIKNENGSLIQSGNSNLRGGRYNYKSLLSGNHFAALICVNKSNPNLIPFIEDRTFSSMEDWIFNLQNSMTDYYHLIDQITIDIVNHPRRSMANNALVVETRLLATAYLLSNLSLNKKEQKRLKAYSYIFCCIHSLLDNARLSALRYLWKAIRKKPFDSTYFRLIIKLILGQRLIDTLRGKA